MIFKIEEKLIYFIEVIHLKIFGCTISAEMKKFLGNLSWSFFGGFIAAGTMFVVNVCAGRILGPLEFGKYNYILSLVTAATFFFLLGNNSSSIRYISDKNHENRKGSFLSALFFLTMFQAIIFLIIVSLTKNIIVGAFNIDPGVVYFVFSLALIFSFKELFDSFIRSFELFKKQSTAKIIDAIFVLGSFLFFYVIFKHKINYIHYAVAMIMGASFSIIYFAYFIIRYFKKFSREEIKNILNYNKFLILGGLSGIIMNLEKVFIGKYIGMESLGIYSAYYASSHMIVSNVGILFVNIFWPAIVKNKDNTKPIIDKLSKVFLRYSPIWFIINFVSVYIFMLFYGNQYVINYWFIFLFSISSIANIFFFIFMNFMNIDKILHSTIISTAIYMILVGSIVVFKSIPAYLIVQIIVYLIGIIYVKKVILRNAIQHL